MLNGCVRVHDFHDCAHVHDCASVHVNDHGDDHDVNARDHGDYDAVQCGYDVRLLLRVCALDELHVDHCVKHSQFLNALIHQYFSDVFLQFNDANLWECRKSHAVSIDLLDLYM